jgi:hypothetical protein
LRDKRTYAEDEMNELENSSTVEAARIAMDWLDEQFNRSGVMKDSYLYHPETAAEQLRTWE